MLSKWLNMKIYDFINMFINRTLGRTSLSATDLTIVSPFLILGSVWFLASGAHILAGCVILFVSLFDVLDGALARAKNEVSRFGAFLDSTLDRYSEGLIFLGLLLYYQQSAQGSIYTLLIYIAIFGSFLTSYTRARAEALGFDCKVGILERPARIILIVIGLLTGWIYVMLWLLAVLTQVTALQRLIHVWKQSRGKKTVKRSLLLPRRGEKHKL